MRLRQQLEALRPPLQEDTAAWQSHPLRLSCYRSPWLLEPGGWRNQRRTKKRKPTSKRWPGAWLGEGIQSWAGKLPRTERLSLRNAPRTSVEVCGASSGHRSTIGRGEVTVSAPRPACSVSRALIHDVRAANQSAVEGLLFRSRHASLSTFQAGSSGRLEGAAATFFAARGPSGPGAAIVLTSFVRTTADFARGAIELGTDEIFITVTPDNLRMLAHLC